MSLRGSYSAMIHWASGGRKPLKGAGTFEEIGAEIQEAIDQELYRTTGDLQPYFVTIAVRDFEPADQRGPMDFTDGPIADNE